MLKLLSLTTGFGALTENRGDIQRAFAFILFITMGLFFYSLSSSTNVNSMELLLGDYPELVQDIGFIAAFTLDPIMWFFASMTFLFFRIWKILRDDEDIERKLERYPEQWERLILFTKIKMWLFLAITIGLSICTYFLSREGAEKFNTTIAERDYKPEYTIEQKTSALSISYDRRVGEIRKDAKDKIDNLKSMYKDKKELADKSSYYARKGMWTDHAKALKAQKWVDGYEYRLQKAYSERDRLIAGETESRESDKSTIENEHNELMKEFKGYKSKLVEFGKTAVNVWSLAGLLVTIINCLLTVEDYSNQALYAVSIDIDDWKNNKDTINNIDQINHKGKKKPFKRTKEPLPTKDKGSSNKTSSDRSKWIFEEWCDRAPNTSSKISDLIDSDSWVSIRDFILQHKGNSNYKYCNQRDVSLMVRSYKDGIQ